MAIDRPGGIDSWICGDDLWWPSNEASVETERLGIGSLGMDGVWPCAVDGVNVCAVFAGVMDMRLAGGS